MRLRLSTIILILYSTLFSAVSQAAEKEVPDSVLKHVFEAARRYDKKIKSYNADVYMRARVQTKKKNFLYRYSHAIPNFVLHDVKNDQALIETVSKIKFEAPNAFYQDVNYVTGTLTHKNDIALLPLKFLSMDVYETDVPGESFYLPLRTETAPYYRYTLDSVTHCGTHTVYAIAYTPRYKNPKLIAGTFTVEDRRWRVLHFRGSGSDLFVNYSFEIEMGNDSLNALLPVAFTIGQSYQYLGNHVLNNFTAQLAYADVRFNDTVTEKPTYHLGSVYRVRLDSVPLNNDSLMWTTLRPFPLTEEELEITENYRRQEAEEAAKKKNGKAKNNGAVALEIAKNMVMDTHYKHKSTTFGFSGLLNPAMIGYSTWDGLTYKQTVNLGFDLERQQSIKINAYAGYLFKKKQLYYQLSGVWNYEPWKLGYLSMVAGKGNPTYSSRFLKLLQDTASTAVNLNLAHYSDYYYKIYNSIEITNGFQVGVGVNYHIRRPIKSTDPDRPILGEPQETQYNFVPKLTLTWTPGQYYVTDGIQKVNVRSDFPTFAVEYAQSLKNVLRGHSSYSRIEFDISQNIRFDLMRKLDYHVGVGFFANQKEEYFNDFTYFAKEYFPATWGDGIGGGFNTLPYDTYNSSDFYAQGHFMYETPRLLLTRLPFLSNGVARERIYISQLYLPTLKSFTELGYGVGNRFVNAAAFVAFDGWKFFNLGGKAVFIW